MPSRAASGKFRGRSRYCGRGRNSSLGYTPASWIVAYSPPTNRRACGISLPSLWFSGKFAVWLRCALGFVGCRLPHNRATGCTACSSGCCGTKRAECTFLRARAGSKYRFRGFFPNQTAVPAACRHRSARTMLPAAARGRTPLQAAFRQRWLRSSSLNPRFWAVRPVFRWRVAAAVERRKRGRSRRAVRHCRSAWCRSGRRRWLGWRWGVPALWRRTVWSVMRRAVFSWRKIKARRPDKMR